LATFRIATFVNDRELYARMRASFEQAGFVEPLARYTIETGEPFAAITRLGSAAEPYVILAHQDVLCDQGQTAADLDRLLGELTKLDDRWVVAGNAGGVDRHRTIIHVSDVWSDPACLPCRVTTLDENLLILRTARRPHCSSGLSGWHLYGSDVCLHAEKSGSSCYVIDFRVTHLSPGKYEDVPEAIKRFSRSWGWRARPRYVRTSWGVFATGPRPVRAVLQWDPIRYRAAAGYPPNHLGPKP
jgi:hypothetical protein